jgi:ABC-2 type transport system permease protein
MLVFNIIIGNKIIAARVDKGSMACLLAAPNTRNTISISSAVFFILSNTVIVGINAAIGLVCTLAYNQADISIKHFLILNAGVIILIVGVSSISFFFSCLFNESKSSVAFGGGIPIVFFLFYMISDMGEKLEVFKKITIYSLFKADKIVNDKYAPVLVGLGILAAMAIILYTAGVRVFNKKDLPV